MRRRARFLRRARELALRDLGGLVYEAARRDQDGGKLVKEKVAHLGVIDSELRALEAELGTPRGETVLREPGVGGTCPRCGELHASDARFCSRCGLDLTAVPAQEAAPGPAEAAAAHATASEAAPATDAGAKPGQPAAASDAAAARPAASGSDAAEPEASEPTSSEHPRRESKRWWRRRSPATSDAPAAEAATSGATGAEAASGATAAEAASEATADEPATNEAPSEPATNETPAAQAAEPETADTPATERPTRDLGAESPGAGNGRATKQDALDPERSA